MSSRELGQRYNWLSTHKVRAALAGLSIAATAAGCGSGDAASAEQGNNETTIAAESFTGTPEPTPGTEASTSNAIDTESNEIPQRVIELMQMTPEEFYQLTLDEQATYYTWQLAHPIHVDTSNFQTTVLDGWDPHFGNYLDEAYNPLENPADWNDSDEQVAKKLQFLMAAVYAQIKVNADEGLDYVDADAAKKMLQLYYQRNFSQLGEEGFNNQIVADAIRSKLDFLNEIGDTVRPGNINYASFELVPGTGEEQTVTSPDGAQERTRSFLATEQGPGGEVTYLVTVTIAAELPTYDGGTTAFWQIADITRP